MTFESTLQDVIRFPFVTHKHISSFHDCWADANLCQAWVPRTWEGSGPVLYRVVRVVQVVVVRGHVAHGARRVDVWNGVEGRNHGGRQEGGRREGGRRRRGPGQVDALQDGLAHLVHPGDQLLLGGEAHTHTRHLFRGESGHILGLTHNSRSNQVNEKIPFLFFFNP